MPTTRPTWYVIPCGADKAAAPAPAAHLYTGGMFRMALAAAEAEAAETDGRVLILSALHGLVDPADVVAPYDVKMGDPGSVTVDTLAAQAAALGITWGADVYAFLPNAYFAQLDQALRADDVYAAQVYEGCGGIGDHRKVCRLVRAA